MFLQMNCCKFYAAGHCKFGNRCRFVHQIYREKIINEPYFLELLLSLPTEIIRLIFDRIYLSDMTLVCTTLDKKICSLYPFVNYSITEVLSDGRRKSTGYIHNKMARNIEDAIFQIAIKSIFQTDSTRSCNCYQLNCEFCQRSMDYITSLADVNGYEVYYPDFTVFRRKLFSTTCRGVIFRCSGVEELKIYNHYFNLQSKTFTVLENFGETYIRHLII